MKNINKINFLLVIGVCMIVGCSSPKPEMMVQSERDKQTYLDKGAMTKRENVSFRLAVCVDPKEYERYPAAGDAVEAQMAEAVSKFKLFQFVERSRINALAAEKLFQGQSTEASSLLTAADYLLSVKLNVSMEECKVRVDFNGNRTNNKYSNRFAKMWRLNVKPDFRLYEVDSGKVVLVKSYEGRVELPGSTIEEARANLQPSIANTMKMLTKGFSMMLTSRYAPKARVLQTRGDGRVAQISIGKEYGMSPGMEVEFYGYEDNSDIVAGGERSESMVGYGRVLEDIGPKSAWAEVLDHSSVKVLRGHYVRAREEKRSEDSIITDLKNFVTVKDEDCIVESHVVPDRGVVTTPSVVRPVPVAQPVAPQPAPIQPVVAVPVKPTSRPIKPATKDSKGIITTANGRGGTREMAELNAYRWALWNALRTYIGEETRKNNEKAIKARLVRLEKFSLKHEILEERQENGRFVVKMRVWVGKRYLAEIFADIFPLEFADVNVKAPVMQPQPVVQPVVQPVQQVTTTTVQPVQQVTPPTFVPVTPIVAPPPSSTVVVPAGYQVCPRCGGRGKEEHAMGLKVKKCKLCGGKGFLPQSQTPPERYHHHRHRH